MFRQIRKRVVPSCVALFYVLALGILTLPMDVYAASPKKCPPGSEFCNPLRDGLNTVSGFTEALLKAVIYILFPIAVLFMIYSGFKFIIAQGNEQELKKAKVNFFWTVIGLSLLLGAVALAAILRGTIDPLIRK